MTDKLQSRPLNMWLLTATIPPLLSVVGRNGWLCVLPAALVCGILCLSVHRYGAKKLPRWLSGLEIIWLVIYTGTIAQESGTCWEGDSSAIPIILLLLGAFAACRGCNSASRVGAVLVWLVLPILGIVALAGTVDFNPNWVKSGVEMPEWTLIGLLLVPCLTVLLPGERGGGISWVIGLIGVIGSVLLAGTMGSFEEGNSFYEFSKGITLLGVAERFESLIACALTLGWVSLFSLLFGTIHHLCEEIYPRISAWCVWICAAASAGVMCILPKNREWVAVGALIFWVFLPLLAQGLVDRKKVVKK